ncbi:MAG: Gfo/Idh/MocA family oxidoreductase [Clostridia bacterium]|nr:Gfo/Idh/MocA family oxidoreductase [Clostridia bacterium]
MSLRVALIGYGVIGHVHAPIIKEHATLCAVCDTDPDKASDFKDIPFYTDYKEMLLKEKPDIVHICTPHYLHTEMIVTALSMDIHVLCEKPMCINEADIGRILEAERNSKAMLGICQQNRYNPANLYLKAAADKAATKSATGQLCWHRGKDYYMSAAWRGKWNTEGGGCLINQALHTLDILQWLVGMPRALRATVSNMTLSDTTEVEDSAIVLGEGENPFVLSATVGFACDQAVSVSLMLGERKMTAEGNRVYEGDTVHVFDNARELGKACYGSSHETLISDFYDCVTTGRHFPIDGAEAAKVIRLILAAYKSEGKPVTI